MIGTKIQNHEYPTLDDMEDDLLLMISNARKYNHPKSQIYKVKNDVGAKLCLTRADCRIPVH